ncbi:DUF1048 domain-containing protein [Nocardioides sp. NPDC126508]
MSIRSIIEALVGSIDQKRQWNAYKARVAELPESHRKAHDAVQRYLMYAGGIADSEMLTQMAGDLLDLFEQSAADGTPVSAIVGDNPAEFVEEFAKNYSEGAWIKKERDRLNNTIDTINREDES